MNFYEEVEKVFHDWRYGHPKILHGLIRSMKPEVVVEIGAYRGYGTAWMAQAVKENGTGHVYAIDNFSLKQFTPDRDAAVQHFWDNLAALGLVEHVTLIEGDSDKVGWPLKVDFAYVDGWHGYPIAYYDFRKSAFLGAECICLDDATQSIGPRMVVQEIRDSGEWDVIDVLRDCGLAICMRKVKKGPITFSQELDDSTGVDLQTLTREEQQEHLSLASSRNGVNYDSVVQSLCEGKKS